MMLLNVNIPQLDRASAQLDQIIAQLQHINDTLENISSEADFTAEDQIVLNAAQQVADAKKRIPPGP